MRFNKTPLTCVWMLAMIVGIMAGRPLVAYSQSSAPLSLPPEFQWSALHEAARTGDLDAVRRLANSTTVATRDKLNRTPLHIAALWGQTEAGEVLIEAGGDIHAEDQWGVTPMTRALLVQQVRGWDRSEFVKMLRDRGAER